MGDKGEDGTNFQPSTSGPLAGLTDYDDEAKGFSYLDTDNGEVYFKNSVATGDWSAPIAFGGGPVTKGKAIVLNGVDTELEDVSVSYVDYVCTIVHNLGFVVSSTLVDDSFIQTMVPVQVVDDNTIKIYFNENHYSQRYCLLDGIH